jgi:4-aminobutyrate aminotransferase
MSSRLLRTASRPGSKNGQRKTSKRLFEKFGRAVGSSNSVIYYPIIVDRASGCIVSDVDGRDYLDFNSSWTVSGVGHANKRVVGAIKSELGRSMGLAAISFPSPKTIEFAERLISLTPGGFEKRVWFGHSGSDACDAAYKLIPKKTGKPRILSFYGSMHGTATGGLAMGGHPAVTKYSTPSNVTKIPYAYCYRCPYGLSYPSCGMYCASDFIEEHVLKNVSPPEETSFVIVEPIQSDAGDIVPPAGYLGKLKRTCEKAGILFVVDEVKTGLGRTGRMFCFEHSPGVVPDAIALGKSLGSGIPVGALVARKELLDEGFALSTLSGNAICAVAGIATLETIKKQGLIENSRKMGDLLIRLLNEMKERHDIIGDVRGKGLIVGIEFVKNRRTKKPAKLECAKIVYRAWQLGLLTVFVGIDSNVMEITPPLIITQKQIERGATIIESAIKDVEAGLVPTSVVSGFAGF